MAKDYYQILGVSKTASKDEIKKAFHKLAMQYHPDKNNGDDSKFKEVNEAYQILSNDEKRAQYDRFGSAGPGGAGFGGQGGFGGFDFSGFQGGQFDFDGFDLNDIFSAFTGGGFQRTPRGRHYQMAIKISFEESLTGVSKSISVGDPANPGKSKKIDIQIPAGIENGQQMKMAGYGEQIKDGRPGDLYITIEVVIPKNFKRQGRNVISEITIPLSLAILGGKYDLLLWDGKEITLNIPKGINTGQFLRVKGKGAPGGDLLIVVQVDIPVNLSKKQKQLIEELKKEGL